ncbi:MAG: hypothetical protein ACXVGH_03745 [Mycobacteriales bacterium]
MLLVPGDLGGDWRRVADRSWRSGMGRSEAAQRARAVRSVTVWRSFRTADRSGWLWCQVTPLGSEQDASEAMSRLGNRFVRNARAQVALSSERQLEPPHVTGADEAWAREQRTTGRAGEGASLLLGVRVGAVVGVVALSGRTATWPAVTAAGEQLVTRIRSRDRG